jgi:zinc protease
MLRKFLFLMFCVLIFKPNLSFAGSNFDPLKLKIPVTKTILPNGLTVLINPGHQVPTVTFQMWFRVGSKYEEPGYTGIAHLFEHMMFKGGKRYNEESFKKLFLANGVNYNAFTTYDYTGYYEDFPPEKLNLILDMESDRLENLALTAENLKSERDVVKEERRMRVDNSISGILNETLWSTAFQVHPYRWPVIGWMKDLDHLSLEKCKSFFKTYYSAANAVLVVAGDIDPQNALQLIQEKFGSLEKVTIPTRMIKPEPPQTGEKKVVLKKDVQSVTLTVGFHTVKQGDPDGYALDLVANIYSEGDSSRLYKRLVNKDQFALGVEASSVTLEDPGMFEIVMQLKPKVDYRLALKSALNELTRLNTVSENELNKAKNQIFRHWVESLKTVHKKSYDLALNEIVTGDYQNMFNDITKYQNVTLDDIKRVINKYFTSQNRTVVAIVPQNSGRGDQ